MLKQQILVKNGAPKEVDHRKKLAQVLEKTLIYLGVVEKHLMVLAGSESIGGHIKSLKWCFKSDLLQMGQIESMQEVERNYVESRREDFKITFRKEPSKIAAQTFDNSGFALFKGRNWRYFMQKLYCVIGRSPANFLSKKK